MAYFPCNMGQTTGTASAATILKDYTAWVNGSKITGTMEDNGSVSQTITPGTTDQIYTIPAGYHSGSGQVEVKGVDITFPTASYILSGASASVTSNGSALASISGTMSNFGGTSQTAAMTQSGSTVTLTIPAAGYYNTASTLTASGVTKTFTMTVKARLNPEGSEYCAEAHVWINGTEYKCITSNSTSDTSKQADFTVTA